MDYNAVLTRSTEVLRALSPHDGQMQLEGVILNTSRWMPNGVLDPSDRALSVSAIDLLESMNYVVRPEPFMLAITARGRSAMAERPMAPVRFEHPAAESWFEQQAFNEALTHGIWSEHNTFSRLTVSGWRQFSEVDIIFHERLTVLTGVNAAGKTTLLNLLSPHFSWSAQFLSSRSGEQEEQSGHIGRLTYSNNATALLVAPAAELSGVAIMHAQLLEQQPVPGIFISSHRSLSSYLALQSLPARFSEAETLLQQFSSEVQMRYQGGSSQYSPLYRMKEGLVSAALYGYGNDAVRANSEARMIWEGFQSILSMLLPEELQFERLAVADGELFFVCSHAEFPLEAASGGISALLELSWQIFLRSKGAEVFTVVIDEPENHLHPAVQRSFMPALLRAFPNVRFVVATHSPFVVTADADAFIYALERDGSGHVRSRRLDSVNAAATSDETLTKVLGLDSPLAIWAERDVAEAVSDLPINPTVEDLRRLQWRLESLGLGDQFPAAIDAIVPKTDA